MPHRLNFLWLVRLRWGALLGQAVSVVIAVALLRISPPWPAVIGVLTAGAAANFAASLWLRNKDDVPESALAGLMALDCVLLTVLLGLCGGQFNPFSTLYLVDIALAGVMLRGGRIFAVTAFALAGYGSLFVPAIWERVHVMPDLPHEAQMQVHLRAMWISFALAAALILYFVHRVTQALAQRERELAASRELSERRARLASLAALAAGAAHELATPLSTIAIVATELQRRVSSLALPADVIEDAGLMRSEVERCRRILQDMAQGAGAAPGEPWASTPARELITRAAAPFSASGQLAVHIAPDAEIAVRGPPKAIARALEGLVKNALQASAEASTPVEVNVARAAAGLCFSVSDSGEGMSAEVQSRAGEPFFTTKAPGQGMGLGLFLTRALAEELGGSLTLSARVPRGVTAVLALPIEGGR